MEQSNGDTTSDELREQEERTLKVTTYLLFYVEAYNAGSVERMSKWMYKIIDTVKESYDGGFMKASKGALKNQLEAKRIAEEGIEALIKQHELDARIDELSHIKNPARTSKQKYLGLDYTVEDRLAELKAEREAL